MLVFNRFSESRIESYQRIECDRLEYVNTLNFAAEY